jgi:hypothetical protein
MECTYRHQTHDGVGGEDDRDADDDVEDEVVPGRDDGEGHRHGHRHGEGADGDVPNRLEEDDADEEVPAGMEARQGGVLVRERRRL